MSLREKMDKDQLVQEEENSFKQPETKLLRKDGITEEEKLLYLEATKIHGNNWREISRFILKNGKSLPKAVYQKYKEANSNEGKMKSIKSRIGNLRRKTKDNPEVSSREKIHVVETSECTSVQDLGIKLQHAKKQEEKGPLSAMKPAKDSDDSLVSDEDAEDHGEESSGSEIRTKRQKKSPKKREQPKKKKRDSKLDKLMKEASKMMDVAGKAAKAHHQYIKAIAANKDINVSSSDDNS